MTRGDEITVSAVDVARAYLKDGFKIIPVPEGKKAPRIKGWQKLKISRRKVTKYFKARGNIGVLLGAKAGWLVDVDLDADEAVAAAGAFLPKTGWIHGRPGKPRSHYFYRAKGVKTRRFNDPAGRCLVELRSTGCQTLVPPSLHPSGQRYMWDRTGKPSRVAANKLGKDVARVAACALLARNWPKKGDRQRCALALAGMLHRAGWSVRRVEHFIKTVARIAGDEEMKKRSEVARATKKNLRKGKAVTGRPALRKILGKSVVNLLTDWLELRKEAEKSIAGPPSRKRAFQIEALRLVELSHPPRRLVEVQAGRAEEMQTLYLSPGTVMEPKKLATAIANQTGEILHKEDSRLGRLAKAVRRIPRVRGVSNLGWTPSLDTFMYGQHALRTAGHPEKLVFLTGETQ